MGYYGSKTQHLKHEKMRKETLPKLLLEVRDLLRQQAEVWDLETLCSFTGYEKSYVYKLTSQKKIPHCKTPGGKTLFFEKSKIIAYMLSNQIKTSAEIDREAEIFIKSNKRI